MGVGAGLHKQAGRLAEQALHSVIAGDGGREGCLQGCLDACYLCCRVPR